MCYICKRKGDIVLEEGTVCEDCFHWLKTNPTPEQIQMRQEYFYYERRRK